MSDSPAANPARPLLFQPFTVRGLTQRLAKADRDGGHPENDRPKVLSFDHDRGMNFCKGHSKS